MSELDERMQPFPTGSLELPSTNAIKHHLFATTGGKALDTS